MKRFGSHSLWAILPLALGLSVVGCQSSSSSTPTSGATAQYTITINNASSSVGPLVIQATTSVANAGDPAGKTTGTGAVNGNPVGTGTYFGAGFSPAFVSVHKTAGSLWAPGTPATIGVIHVAQWAKFTDADLESGPQTAGSHDQSITTFSNGQITSGEALSNALAGSAPFGPGSSVTATGITVDQNHPYVSLVGMIGNSNGFLYGVNSTQLFSNHAWQSTVTVPIYGYSTESVPIWNVDNTAYRGKTAPLGFSASIFALASVSAAFSPSSSFTSTLLNAGNPLATANTTGTAASFAPGSIVLINNSTTVPGNIRVAYDGTASPSTSTAPKQLGTIVFTQTK